MTPESPWRAQGSAPACPDDPDAHLSRDRWFARAEAHRRGGNALAARGAPAEAVAACYRRAVAVTLGHLAWAAGELSGERFAPPGSWPACRALVEAACGGESLRDLDAAGEALAEFEALAESPRPPRLAPAANRALTLLDACADELHERLERAWDRELGRAG